MNQLALFERTHAKQTVLRGARYAQQETLRLSLTREWGAGPSVCYIGHNPSTATHLKDDPTSVAWTHFARAQGYGRYVAVNLYPFRSSDPAACRRWADYESNGPDWYARDALLMNSGHVGTEAKRADIVVASWGAIALDTDWVDTIVEEITSGEEPWPDIYCLGTTASGAPKHPLARGKHRIDRNQKFILWRAA